MSVLTGKYECKLDSKGRLKLPSGLLRQLPEDYSGRFVINKGPDNHLDLYTIEEWELIAKKIRDTLNRFNSQHRLFFRDFYDNAFTLEMDKSERILIPQSSAEMVGLKDKAIVFCYDKSIEIWSQEAYNQRKRSDNFSDLADSIFGNSNFNMP